MPVPEILSVLGGIVDDLDQARQRLVSEVNKPPRGKRKHGGIPLSRRASLAAWSSDIGTGTIDVNAQSNLTDPAPQRANAAQLTQPEPSANHERDAEQFLGGGNPRVVGQSITSTNEEHSPTARRSYLVPLCGGGSPRISGRNITIEENDMVVDEDPPPVNNRRDSEQVECLESLFSDRSTAAQGNDMVDVDEDDDTMMDLVGDGASGDKLQMKNSPFTYMSSLQAQWDKEESQTEHSIRGRIKVRSHGVKGKFGFQGKFDLQAYIDDGSLILWSRLITMLSRKEFHTPEEVVAALKSPDTKTEDDMRQTMRNFQDFLRQFEVSS
ncbi:RecQ-mediated genome instability protein 1 [Rhynchospora pubera]|uniref:RecQ-mediated genome instability protein 1 n=1 Tax=Rhynchospora pubera TaxID=906938 RepID=A0AAV8D644_9POAL|nr:RecQ-mediated genome instability protein 1 [Rhynchospora pubera]